MAMARTDREIMLAEFRKVGIDIDAILRLEPSDEALLSLRHDMFRSRTELAPGMQ